MSAPKPMLLTLAGFMLAGAASAQTRPALVQDVDSDARAPWQEAQVVACQFAGDCAMTGFTTVAAGRRRVIEYVTCIISMTGGSGVVQTLSLNATSFRTPRAFFPTTAAPATPGTYIGGGTTLIYFNAGETPRLDAFTSLPASQIICTMTGREVAVP